MSQFTHLSNLYDSDFTELSFNKALKKCAIRAYYGRKTHLILRFTNIREKPIYTLTNGQIAKKAPKLTIEKYIFVLSGGYGHFEGDGGTFYMKF